MIALARNFKRKGPRYVLAGEISKYATWAQTLELPADDETVSITGSSVKITFRECEDDTSAALTLTSQITISDADTLAIDASVSDLSGLREGTYVVDIASSLAGDVTHWAHGKVLVTASPVTF